MGSLDGDLLNPESRDHMLAVVECCIGDHFLQRFLELSESRARN
jgi:hypothetical protein